MMNVFKYVKRYTEGYFSVIKNDGLDKAFYAIIAFLLVLIGLNYAGFLEDDFWEKFDTFLGEFLSANFLSIDVWFLFIMFFLAVSGLIKAIFNYRNEQLALKLKEDFIPKLQPMKSWKDRKKSLLLALLLSVFGVVWIAIANSFAKELTEITTIILMDMELDFMIDWVFLVPSILVLTGVPWCVPVFIAGFIGVLVASLIGLNWFLFPVAIILAVPLFLLFNEFAVSKMNFKHLENEIVNS